MVSLPHTPISILLGFVDCSLTRLLPCRCGPCRLTNPVVKEVMKQYAGDIDVVEVCTDDLAEIAEEAGIMSIPTIRFFYGGEALETIVGCVAKSVLANAVDKVLEDIQQGQQQKTP
jgi:thioredoxin-like negative regulator of GroEL